MPDSTELPNPFAEAATRKMPDAYVAERRRFDLPVSTCTQNLRGGIIELVKTGALAAVILDGELRVESRELDGYVL